MRKRTGPSGPRLPAAVVLGYVRAGWRVRNGHIESGQVVGPCAICRRPTVVYGPHGRPTCHTCRTGEPDGTWDMD